MLTHGLVMQAVDKTVEEGQPPEKYYRDLDVYSIIRLQEASNQTMKNKLELISKGFLVGVPLSLNHIILNVSDNVFSSDCSVLISERSRSANMKFGDISGFAYRLPLLVTVFKNGSVSSRTFFILTNIIP